MIFAGFTLQYAIFSLDNLDNHRRVARKKVNTIVMRAMIFQ